MARTQRRGEGEGTGSLESGRPADADEVVSVNGNFLAIPQRSTAQVAGDERGLFVFWWLNLPFFWLCCFDAAAAVMLLQESM